MEIIFKGPENFRKERGPETWLTNQNSTNHPIDDF